MPGNVIPESEWRWLGYAGHFISSNRCRYHLTTQVGEYLVSTVGDMWNDDQHDDPQEIGEGYFFETVVCRVVGQRSCGCLKTGEELDTTTYGRRETTDDQHCMELDDGHREMCRKWARR